ncbi:MAG: substrate-binding domain-containing protein [Verrucomicrobia bacterium]|nr:substrate-binding domain-containing protein [Verrucomicrobiota bacterium]
MIAIPRRMTLVSQAAEILRAELRRGAWKERLPPERMLCDRLQISRGTLRATLKILRQEGLIRIVHGQLSRIGRRPRKRPTTTGPKVVGFMSPSPLSAYSGGGILCLSELQRHLFDASIRLEMHTGLRDIRSSRARRWEGLIARTQAAGWILYLSTATMQRWFAERKIPTLVMGGCHSGVQLPSLNFDYRAVCRHAVGMFLSLGHRRIAFLEPKTGWAGLMSSEQGFREGFEVSRHPDAAPQVVWHDPTVEGVRKSLRSLFKLSRPPSAILVAHAPYMHTVLTHLIHEGIRVPEQVSLIARNADPMLSFLVPSIAHYRVDTTLYARRLSRMVLQLVSAEALPARQDLIALCFKNGETLARWQE